MAGVAKASALIGAPGRAQALAATREEARHCVACPLYRNATQTVFGRGRIRASLMLVGEQPGNDEDLRGEPFVGPAGRVLAAGLEAAGIDPASVYVTNAVKHFKWVPRGKRRIHQKPAAREVAACRPWLEREIELVRPRVLCCLGATAAQSLLGPAFRVTRQRGIEVESDLANHVLATVHPSSILRADEAQRAEEMGRFVDDLRAVAGLLAR